MRDHQRSDFFSEQHGLMTNTRPEKNLDLYQQSRGLNLIHDIEGRKRRFAPPDDPRVYFFQCDFVRPTDTDFDIDIEADGQRYHSSDRQRHNDDWRDSIINACGKKVIRIPAAETEKRFWPDLDKILPRAFASPVMQIRLWETPI